MKLSNYLLLSGAGIFIMQALVGPLAFAQEANKPTKGEIQTSHDRGFYGEPVGSASANMSNVKLNDLGILPKSKSTKAQKPQTQANTQAQTKVKPAKSQDAVATSKNSHNKTSVKTVPAATNSSVTATNAGKQITLSTSAGPEGNNDQTNLVFTASLNKPGRQPVYKAGEKLEVKVTAATDCNIVIFDYDGKGTLTQIFPNKLQENGFVKAGHSVFVGGADSPFDFTVSGSGGKEQIFVYAYPASEEPFTIAMAPTRATFRSVEYTPEQYRKLVNESKVYFSREIKVTPKVSSTQNVVNTLPPVPGNKIELSLIVDNK